MQQEMSRVRLDEMRGQPVYDSGGDKIGSIEEIYYDQQTSVPEWIGIGTGFFGTKRVLVPVKGASTTEDGVMVPYSKDQVKDSPDIDADEISQETEAELFSYYGLDYSHERSGTGLPEGGTGAYETGTTGGGVTETSDAVTRHEEELQVGKREQEAGRVRLRKWVETEPVAMDVELRREAARVVREPVDQPVGEGEIGEQTVEMSLREEQPVVGKQTVAKERVGLEKDVDTERQTVEGEIQKERVEVEGADERL